MTSHPALTFPTPQGESQAPVVSTAAPPVIRKDRLYVGNLHPTVDEYTLLQIFSKCGKISRMDYLFHKSGPSKGKPRGYAFIEYSNPEDANKALAALHNRVVRGRKLVVTFATQTPYPESSSSLSSTTRTGPRRHASEASRPTALSLIKTHARPENTQAKIAALEAKLKQMQAPPGGEGDSAKGLGSLPKKPPAPHRR
ncbi:hypothetical protein BS47DRAFT_1346391 [Hydnum rufescens UP504]|uniref:Probable RNA-binding protein 18 n=1 Tax=Hydnum rufescens UP504 TaxID=1448309 RepID=A0A9P6DS02_9AGAM|nr:hypothetical protein BS47DRAFT_1346391 [Hydnum rufescens UP504]